MLKKQESRTWFLLREKYEEKDIESLLSLLYELNDELLPVIFTRSLTESHVIVCPDSKRRIQSGSIFIQDLYDVLFGPYDELPLYLEAEAYIVPITVKWRLNLGY